MSKNNFFSRYKPLGNKMRGIIKLSIALALVLSAYMLFSDKNPDPGAMASRGPNTPVRIVEATYSNFPIFFNSLGTVIAANTITIRSRVNGELLRLHFTDGQKVKAGDLLAEIDPAPLKAQVDQAGGQLQRDQAVLQNARQNLARSQKLLPQKSR
jgi:multidrug efflux pump subunit AcrA (membrane-fusion protein)